MLVNGALALYVERGLWERFLAKAAGNTSSAACLGAGQSDAPRCGRGSAVALWTEVR